MRRSTSIFISFILAFVCCIFVYLPVDAGSKEQKKEAEKIYSEVMNQDHISIESANQLLSQFEYDKGAMGDMVRQIAELKDCSGAFVQTSEETGNRYSAKVSFYLEKGEVYSSIEYSGFIGTIGNGKVEKSTDKDYLYQSEPKGDLAGREMDFSIHYSKQLLHIQWGDACDYVLDRGDGSVDSVSDYKTPLDQTEIYKKLEQILDDGFGSKGYSMSYDRDIQSLNIYVEAPANTRKNIISKYSKIKDTWEDMLSAMKEQAKDFYSVVYVTGKCEHVNMYLVDEIKDSNDYDESDYLVWVENDTLKYNYPEDGRYSSEEVSDESDKDLSYYSIGSGSGGSSSSATVKCSSCNGTGSVKYYYGESDLEAVLSGHDPYEYGPCSSCDGTGYVTFNNVSGSGKEVCPSCGKRVNSLQTKQDAAGVSRTWCSDCWKDYDAIMN